MMPDRLDELQQESIEFEKAREEITGEERDFPKYTTQILNIANQNAQGTRPEVVGQMSELIDDCPDNTYEGWRDWYLENNSDAIDEATERVWEMVQKMQDAMEKIDEEMVREWVEDLVIDKTAEGLIIEEAVLETLSDEFGVEYKDSTAEEESKNIDGYVGEQQVSVKSQSYLSKRSSVREEIDVPIVYYKKTEKYLHIYWDEEEFDV